MDLQKIAKTLNINSYPEELNNIENFNTVPDISNIQWLEETEQTYQVLGKYYHLVHRAALELQRDRARYLWGMTTAVYLSGCTVSQARLIPTPPRDGTLASDFLPLLILLTQLPAGVEQYRRRKMPEDMIRRNLDHIVEGISIVEYRTGTPAVDQTYFNWLVKFVKGTIFNCYGFNFEVRELPGKLIVLQDKTNGTLYPVIQDTLIHRTGNILNSAGCSDTAGSFSSKFTETDQQFTLHPCYNGLVSSKEETFPKEQFKIVLRSGDTVLSVHIPKGTDISARRTTESLSAGFRDAIKYYPEADIKALYCHSWLLDPNLKILLNPSAKIPQFGNLFTRYPAKSAGMEVFSFVFKNPMPLYELPENTSLERALKQHYINGHHILAYSGIILPDQL